MTENTQPDLASQFRELGENLKNMFQSAWESEEAQTFKEELRDGLQELGSAAKDAAEDFQLSEAGQRLKTEAEEFKSRVESGEVETKARQEISNALDMINTELQKAIQSFSEPKSGPEA
jgi:septation ring formation regulator EzrA